MSNAAPETIAAPATPRRPAKRRWRSWWLKQLHTWHWVSAAISLVAMLLFAITGITLNHAASIAATPTVTQGNAALPPALLPTLGGSPAAEAPLPAPVADAVAKATGITVADHAAEWSDGEVYIATPRPGGDAWVSIDRTNGKITSEITDRGWVSYLNDLHKGRNTGDAWFWFIDVFAGACILFTLTGLLLLQLHARHRPSTWPVVIAGLVLPVLIAVFLIH